MIPISHLKLCCLKFESYALGARICMNEAIDLKELQPGVYGIPPKREPFFQPGLGLKIVFFFFVYRDISVGGRRSGERH